MPGTLSGKLGGTAICRSYILWKVGWSCELHLLESWVQLRAVDHTDTAKTARVSLNIASLSQAMCLSNRSDSGSQS